MSLELKNSKKDFLNQNKEQTSNLEKQIKDHMKQIEELKEIVYEHENKNTELEF
jgi:septal ring factor EnvC (AmiA/AmiB activator)